MFRVTGVRMYYKLHNIFQHNLCLWHCRFWTRTSRISSSSILMAAFSGLRLATFRVSAVVTCCFGVLMTAFPLCFCIFNLTGKCFKTVLAWTGFSTVTHVAPTQKTPQLAPFLPRRAGISNVFDCEDGILILQKAQWNLTDHCQSIVLSKFQPVGAFYFTNVTSHSITLQVLRGSSLRGRQDFWEWKTINLTTKTYVKMPSFFPCVQKVCRAYNIHEKQENKSVDGSKCVTQSGSFMGKWL